MTGAPLPPRDLTNRVCSLAGHDDPDEAYERLGGEARAALLELLPDAWSFEGKRVLDFGCGAGRTLRHFLGEAATAELWGTDIDEPSIDWLERHLCPPLHAARNAAAPPTRFGDGDFDLIWALSVFTHLTSETSLPWLLELHRLLAPGGLLVASYMGRYNGDAFTGEAWDDDLVGMNVLRADQSWDIGGPMTLMSDWWVREHWGRAFEILDVAPVHGQSWALLRKRDVELTVADLERLSDDPRELAALRHNVDQVERDRQAMLAGTTAYYETSLSWRLTRPLRMVSRALRRRGWDSNPRGR